MNRSLQNIGWLAILHIYVVQENTRGQRGINLKVDKAVNVIRFLGEKNKKSIRQYVVLEL